jgi:hypothetical protein
VIGKLRPSWLLRGRNNDIGSCLRPSICFVHVIMDQLMVYVVGSLKM